MRAKSKFPSRLLTFFYHRQTLLLYGSELQLLINHKPPVFLVHGFFIPVAGSVSRLLRKGDFAGILSRSEGGGLDGMDIAAES